MSKSAKELLESIKTLSNGVKVAPTPATQAALDNIEIRIAQFEENLKNPLPTYLFDGQTAVLTDLRKKRDGLIAGTISIEAAMSVEPLEERTVVDELPTETLAVAIATMPTVEQPTDVEAPANAELSIAAPEVPNPQIDPALLAAIVTRIRATVVEQVVAEAAKMMIEAKKKAIADAVVQLKREMQNAE